MLCTRIIYVYFWYDVRNVHSEHMYSHRYVLYESSANKSFKFLAGHNIQPVGGTKTKGHGITNTRECLKDVDKHMIKLLTLEVLGDKPGRIQYSTSS